MTLRISSSLFQKNLLKKNILENPQELSSTTQRRLARQKIIKTIHLYIFDVMDLRRITKNHVWLGCRSPMLFSRSSKVRGFQDIRPFILGSPTRKKSQGLRSGDRDFPSIGFLVPPPPFIFVPLSPPLAAAIGPLAFSSRSARPPSLFQPRGSAPKPLGLRTHKGEGGGEPNIQYCD